MKITSNGNRILLDKEKQNELRMWQALQDVMNDVPKKFHDENFKMFYMNLRFKIADLKNGLYGEQTELTLYLRERSESG